MKDLRLGLSHYLGSFSMGSQLQVLKTSMKKAYSETPGPLISRETQQHPSFNELMN